MVNPSGTQLPTLEYEPIKIVRGTLSAKKISILRARNTLNLESLKRDFSEDDLRNIAQVNRLECDGGKILA